MDRLTDCAQGYCEMYCKKYMLCFEDPENCVFKDEIKLYDALKSIEGIVPLDRLLELACADKDGRLVVLPCKVGDTVYEPNKRGFISTYKVVSIHLSTCSILIGWDLIDGIYSNVNGFEASAIGKTVFLTREEAEAALAGKGGAE